VVSFIDQLSLSLYIVNVDDIGDVLQFYLNNTDLDEEEFDAMLAPRLQLRSKRTLDDSDDEGNFEELSREKRLRDNEEEHEEVVMGSHIDSRDKRPRDDNDEEAAELEPAKVQIIEHRLGGRLVRRTRLFQ
jgi:hypothetical protein